MEPINPTRMNLLARRGQIKLARQGADLLNRKKDALLREFFGLVGTACELRERLSANLRQATTAFVLAEADHGPAALASAAAASAAEIDVRLTPRNLWGVHVIDIQHTYAVRDVLARPYSPCSTPLSVDEAAAGLEQVVLAILDLAPREVHLRRIGEDIRRTNRKINALEQQVIPRLESQARYINQVLEERARDDVIRLKRLKQKRARTDHETP